MAQVAITPGQFNYIREAERQRARYGQPPPDLKDVIRLVVGPMRFDEAARTGVVELVVDWNADRRPFGQPELPA